MINQPNNLSLEQQFKLTAYRSEMSKLTIKQSRKYLQVTLRHMLIKDNLIKLLLKRENSEN
jgi:Phycobilisome degradation protein nblA